MLCNISESNCCFLSHYFVVGFLLVLYIVIADLFSNFIAETIFNYLLGSILSLFAISYFFFLCFSVMRNRKEKLELQNTVFSLSSFSFPDEKLLHYTPSAIWLSRS